MSGHDFSDANLLRFRERWWHLFGRCPWCWVRYNDGFVVRGFRYCFNCYLDTVERP